MIELNVGAEAIQRLLDAPRPWRMLDRLGEWTPDRRALSACRHITANEAIFTGHFAQLALWPGVATLETLVQTCAVAARLDALAATHGAEAVAETLRTVHRLHRLLPHRGPDPLDLGLPAAPPTRYRTDVKLLAPVFAGCRLDLSCSAGRTGYRVEARVDDRVVARGAVTLSPP